jgi:hypothetical protein
MANDTLSLGPRADQRALIVARCFSALLFPAQRYAFPLCFLSRRVNGALEPKVKRQQLVWVLYFVCTCCVGFSLEGCSQEIQITRLRFILLALEFHFLKSVNV